jgi:iron(III) transport system substrate-binding protein
VRAPVKISALAAAVALTAAVTSCSTGGGSSSSSSATPTASAAPLSQAALIAGSKHEKGLVIYSNALSSQMQQVTKAFTATYPWVHVTATDDEDPVIFSKYAAEHGTGARTADILIASAPGLWVGSGRPRLPAAVHPHGDLGFPGLHLAGRRLVRLLARSGGHDL